MTCEHVDYDDYFGKCFECGAEYEDILQEEIANCTTPEHAQELAIDWQAWQQENSLSYGELAEWQNRFESLAVQHGLTEEFRENGII